MVTSAPIPPRLHPESTADPMTLRWVTDTALTEPTEQMQQLVADGTLAALDISPGQIHTSLAPDRSWSQEGPRVRTILFQALSAQTPNHPADSGSLREQVAEVLRREVEPYVDSHGGQVQIESLDDGTLTVSLGGACGHCTLRSTTLRTLVAKAVQDRFPQIRRVRAVKH